MMFRIIAILSVLLVVALIAVGYLMGKPSGKSAGSFSVVENKQNTSIHTTVKAILPAAEFVSMNYYYTSIIKDANSIDVFGIQMPFTERKLLVLISGTMKLGIHCELIEIDSTRTDTLFIKFPPIKIIAHEVHPETAEVYDQKNGIFNKYTAKEHFALEAKHKSEMELDVRANMDLIKQARAFTENSFRELFKMVPQLPDTLAVSFRWH